MAKSNRALLQPVRGFAKLPDIKTSGEMRGSASANRVEHHGGSREAMCPKGKHVPEGRSS